MKKSLSTAASLLSGLAATALFLSFGPATPLPAQGSDPYLNYLDHVSLDFAHSTVVSSNIALYYRDYRGNLQHPSDDTIDPLYLFATKAFHRVAYDSSGFNRKFGEVGAETAWDPTIVAFPAGNISLGAGTEVSYTPRQTPYPPPTNGPDPVYYQPAMMTGARNALYDYGLVRQTRERLVTVSTDPATPPFTPGNALLATGPYSVLLTTNGGIYALLDTSGGNGQMTPFITAQGSGPGQLSNPSALNIGPDGLLYVLDSGNNRIQKFDRTTGAYRGEFSLPGGVTVSPTSLAISTEGRIYLGDGVGGGFVFNLTGTLLTTFHPPAADPSWVDGGLIAGSAVGVSFLNYDGRGNIFTYVEGQGLFMFRDPSYNELNYVNLNIMSAVTSAPGNSIVNSLSFDDDRAVLGDRRNGTLTIVEPMQVRTGNIYTEAGAVATIEGGTIVTAGDVTKINQGTLILNNANTYTGRTLVADGTLIVNGSVAGEVVVSTGATLGGSGTIGGLTTLADGAHLAPGNSPGTITFNDGLTLAAGSILDFQLGTASDLIAVTGGTLTGPTGLGGITLNLANAGGFASGVYTLVDFTGATPNEFDLTDFAFGSLPAGSQPSNYSLGFSGSQLNLTYNASAIPEPSTYAMLTGVACLGIAAWRRRARVAGPQTG